MTKILKTTDQNVTQITNLDNRFYFISRDALNDAPKEFVKDWWGKQIEAHGGIYLPATTWILEKYPKDIGFYAWLANQPGEEAAKRLKEKAGDRGSRVHHAIEDLIKGNEVSRDDKYFSEITEDERKLNSEEWRAIIAFADWWQLHLPAVISLERTVYSLKHCYAGTADFIGALTRECADRHCPCRNLVGKVSLIDWKTSKAVYPSYRAQTAAYAAAIKERGDTKVEACAILLLGTNHKTKFKFEQVEDLTTAFRAFLASKTIFDSEPHPTEPEIEEVPLSLKINVKWLSQQISQSNNQSDQNLTPFLKTPTRLKSKKLKTAKGRSLKSRGKKKPLLDSHSA